MIGRTWKLCWTLLVCAVTSAFIGCGPLEPPDKTLPENQILQGTWLTSCVEEKGTRLSRSYDFSGNDVTFSVLYYQDPACQLVTATERYQGTFVAGSAGENITTLDLNLQQITLTPDTPEQAEQFNQTQFCNDDDWLANEAKDIGGKTCTGETYPPPGTQIFTAFSLQNNQLRLGKWAQTNSQRPKQTETTLYQKQTP